MKFLRKLAGVGEEAGGSGDWEIVTARNEVSGESAVFRARFSRPDRPDLAKLGTAIVIKWPYQGDGGMPPSDVNQAHLAFEEALDPLASADASELVHVSTGLGLKEWIYYAEDRESFLALLNQRLAGHPAYPLEIEIFDDPGWRVWKDMVKTLSARRPT